MAVPRNRPPAGSYHSRFGPTFAAAVLVGAIALAYANSLHAPFVFDDIRSITENPTLRRLDASVLSPPPGLTVSGRPLANLSLALNHAISGTSVRGYHLTNVGIHMLATLVFFGLLRRTFRIMAANTGESTGATWLAFAAALVWALHPLQTESVTYVVQRTESLMGLFFLLTLYCFVRGATGLATPWFTFSVFACALGMATKEVMVTAPIVALLYDRTFLAGSWRELWGARRRAHVALAATWLVLAFLVWRTGDRAGTAGFSTGVSPWEYAFTQSRAIVHYLQLAAWPHPLVFDHGEYESAETLPLLPFAVLVAVLIAGALRLSRRRPGAGFAALAFFVILAPTSSVLPILTEPVAEHRMYLPLAALAALAAGVLHTLTGRRAIALLLAMALAAGLATSRRNRDYQSERMLWETTIAVASRNARAHSSLALALVEQGEFTRAESHFNTAIALRPDFINARARLGALLADQGRLAEAEAQCLAILKYHPTDFVAHNTLGTIHYGQGRLHDAVADFQRALRTDPNSAPAHNNLGGIFVELGDLAAASTHLETALRLDPDYAEAHYNLGNLLARQNRFTDARRAYLEALRLRRDYAQAHAHLGVVLQNLGEHTIAIRHYREALRLRPDFTFVRENLEALGGR